METLSSSIDPSSPEFQRNAEHHKQFANQLRQRLTLVYEGGGEKYRKRQEEQGKLFVRDRIEALKFTRGSIDTQIPEYANVCGEFYAKVRTTSA